MAVAAHENNLIIYRLKGMDQIRSEVERHETLLVEDFMPIQEVCTLQLLGIKQHTDGDNVHRRDIFPWTELF